jgi:imidazolonepropionase-like amidohydrolase
MTAQHLKEQLVALTAQLAERALDAGLQTCLNTDYCPTSEGYRALHAACLAGVAQGWLCDREAGGLR